jgi:glucose/arabinose dehydrogenase
MNTQFATFIFRCSILIPLALGGGLSSLLSAPTRVQVDGFLDNVFPENTPNSTRDWRLEQAFPSGGVGGIVFNEPMGFVAVPDSPAKYVWGKKGQIWLMEDGFNEDLKQVALDIRSKTSTSGEAGLQSIALHPEFGQVGSPNRGYIYLVHNTIQDWSPPKPSYALRWRLARYNVIDPDNSLIIDPTSELILVDQYTRHIHHGGALFFGPLDGFLYFSVGDGDTAANSQQIDLRLFGGIFRIDVDMNPALSHPIPKQPVDGITAEYYIPNDNPFVGVPGALGEFYALGLRNPYRVTADRQTGAIFAGDVGGNRLEEINQIVPGGNYQWKYREGHHVLSSPPNPMIGIDQAPIHVFGHDLANAIIGGFTYRGSAYSGELDGRYLFAVLGSGIIYSLEDPQNGSYDLSALAEMPQAPPPNFRRAAMVGFSEDEDGELYVAQLDPNGKIFKLVKNDEEGPAFPLLLSETGAFTDTANMVPAPFLIPYDVNSPLWSDGTLKKRWVVMPNDGAPYQPSVEQAVWTEKYEWFFPPGTVFVKHFELPVDDGDPFVIRRLETRFLVLDNQGQSYGLTYRWRPDHSEADLVDVDGLEENIEIVTVNDQTRTQTWAYPSRNQCMQCHTPQTHYVLGANTRQLNRTIDYEAINENQNQLLSWSEAGLIQGLTLNDLEKASALVELDDVAPLEDKVRSYLDTNCAHCHQPGGGRALFDARWDTPVVAQGFINGRTFETSDSILVVPGDPAGSYIYQRLSTLGISQMPPLPKNALHGEAISALHDYILQWDLDGSLSESWEQTHLGTTYQKGFARHKDGKFELGSAGFLNSSQDNILLVHQSIEGDFELIAKVSEPRLNGTNKITLAGLIARENLTPGSPMFSVINTGVIRPSFRIWGRKTQNVNIDTRITASNSNFPYLRLTRNGDILRGYYSRNRTTWTLAHTGANYLQSGPLEVGMFLGGHTDAGKEINSLTFDQVSLDKTTVSVVAVDAVAVEGSADNGGELRFTRSGPLDDILVLRLSWSGVAANSHDVALMPAVLTFHPSENSLSLAVDALADNEEDPAEALTVTIAPDSRFVRTKSSATVGLGESTFDGWRALWYSPAELSNSSVSGKLANGDKDAYNTWMEFFLGTNPKLAEGEVVTAWIQNNALYMRYPQNLYAGAQIGKITASATLGSWVDTTVIDVESEIIGMQEWKTVRDLRSIDNNETLFLRLEVDTP